MKLLPLVALLISNLVLADPCLEGQLCSSVDMKSAPEGTHKQTLCQPILPNDTATTKQCRIAVWVPFHFQDVSWKNMFIDINSFRVDEEDVFISYKAQDDTRFETLTLSTVFSVRFDCERQLYKTLTIERLENNKVVTVETPTDKPAKIDSGYMLSSLYDYGCALHDVIIHGGE
jgi:hypothetical protein